MIAKVFRGPVKVWAVMQEDRMGAHGAHFDRMRCCKPSRDSAKCKLCNTLRSTTTVSTWKPSAPPTVFFRLLSSPPFSPSGLAIALRSIIIWTTEVLRRTPLLSNILVHVKHRRVVDCDTSAACRSFRLRHAFRPGFLAT